MFGCLPWWVRIDWRVKRRWVLALCGTELVPTVAALTLFGIADPNTYRTKLWQEGYIHGWNSSPKEALYAAANYRPFSPPTPWNQFTTSWNVVISILSTFILIVKIVMFLTHTFPPLFSAALHLGLVIVWAYSASLQAGSDYSDPKYPSKVPWYLTHSCGSPVTPANQGYCEQAKAAFGVTIIEVFVFFVFFVFSVFMSFPSEEQKARRAEKEQEKREWAEIENFDDKQFNYELDQMHMNMQTPSSGYFPMGAGVLQQQQQQQYLQQHQQQQHFQQEYQQQQPPASTTPAKSDFHFTTSVSETSTPVMQESWPNRDLPLKHHFSSDVYT